MALWQGKAKRKKTGGRRVYARKKRKYEIGREKRDTSLGEHKIHVFRTRGDNRKIRVLRAGIANIFDPKENKSQKTKILSVIENTANPHYVRRNVITKGAVIKTEIGDAKVTSRPGQDGVINAILIQ